MHQTHVEFNIVFNKKKSKNNRNINKKHQTQYQKNKSKQNKIKQQRPAIQASCYTYVLYTWISCRLVLVLLLLVYATLAISMICIAICRYFFQFVSVFFHSLHSFCVLHYVCVCLLVICEQKFYYFYRRMEWCWFQLQFPHRLQYLTKFQCEINNNNCIHRHKKPKKKKKLFVCTTKCKEKATTALASMHWKVLPDSRPSDVCKSKRPNSFFHSSSASETVLTSYNYHLDTSSISLCIKKNYLFNTEIQARPSSVEIFLNLTFELICLLWCDFFVAAVSVVFISVSFR